jgi:competence protein ComEC
VALVRSTSLLNVMPWLSWQTPPVAVWWTVAYYVALIVLLMATGAPRGRRVAQVVWTASLLIIVTTPPWPSAAPAAGLMRISMLDVGQGQSIAVQFPTGQSLLLDTGGAGPSFDMGSRVVKPALWALGIRRLDWLAITHGDQDHAGGAPSLLRDMGPREVWEGVPVPRDARMQALRASAHEQGVVWRRLATGHVLEVGSAVVEVLNPPLPDWERRDNRNDDSLVVRVQLGQVSLVLTGDAERQAEAALTVDRSARLRVLSAPHHGSRTSSTPPLLQRFLPHAVLVSAGRGNTFGHPAPDVLARYEQLGVEIFRTDRDGAIVIETDGRVVNVRTANGRSWRLAYAEWPREGS